MLWYLYNNTQFTTLAAAATPPPDGGKLDPQNWTFILDK